jgi:site-specific DNA-methyltransferase (adenine-specific)
MDINKIYNEDCLDTMSRMPNRFIDLTVTSPPYDNLRDYCGYSFDFESIAKELYRVTKLGGVVVWIVGDTTKDFCESLTSFKQAIYFVNNCGFKLLDTMIYHKTKYAPAYPTIRRYAQAFEYMFVIVKGGRPKTFNAVQRERATSGYNRYAEYRQKDGTRTRKLVSHNRETKDACNVWSICPGLSKKKETGNHPAVFPEQLAHDHIISWSNEGDLVYDPFMGSGTTAKVAKFLRRNYIGSEISKEYCKIAWNRVINVL